jgi:hypothetical protein
MKTVIFQSSPYRTASTLLVNALYGLIPSLIDKRVVGAWEQTIDNSPDNIIVLKSHDLDIDKYIAEYGHKHNLYFVCSERIALNKMIPNNYKSYPNVCVFEYAELNETKTYTVPKIVQHIHDKLRGVFASDIELHVDTGIQRVLAMNRKFEEIKDKPFTYVDTFYQIHGSHRNRTPLPLPSPTKIKKKRILG